MIDRAKHFLLNGIAGWRAASLDKTTVADGDLELQPMPGSVQPLADASGSFGGLQNPQGVAIDQQDRVYVLDGAACVVKRYDRCLQQFIDLPCIGPRGHEPRRLASPHGLAISCADDIYIADSGNRRVQVFSVKGLALRRIWEPIEVVRRAGGISVKRALPLWVAGKPTFGEGTWQPSDIALTSRNWAYVSDYANGLIHVFDPRGCWRAAYDGYSQSSTALVKPTRLALDRDGRIYVLQVGARYVTVLDKAGKYLGKVTQPEEVEGRFCPVAVAIDGNGNLCLSDCMTRKVYFYQPTGDGGWCRFRCCGSTGSFADSVAFDRAGNAIHAGAQGLCQLAAAAYPPSGTYYSAALDSKIYRCLWHRILLEGCVPSGTAVRVDTFTAEFPKTDDEIAGLAESRWSTGQIDTGMSAHSWDCLIQAPPGRYLWLRLTLTGDGSVTPVIGKAKVYYPRSSSLKYLPAVYRADAVSADFLDRFLSLFDTLRARDSGLITDIARMFDPMATPASRKNAGGVDFLSWLASWLGIALQSNWPVARKRELVRRAHELFALRGTPRGLQLQVELYAGVQPRILEMFRLRRWLLVNGSTLGNDTTLFGNAVMNRLQVGVNSQVGSFQLFDFGDPQFDLFNKYAYQFVVVVPRWPGASAADAQNLQQIIDMAKPAHTLGQLQWAEPRLRIGLQAFVGVDTVIGKYPAGVIEGQGKLGYDTVLGSPSESDKRPGMRIGRKSTIGCNSVLT
ncbi:MAG TPA: phage tail protein [Verrucomicrobiae bacterium]|nr:phage tail protein [Verrucomicrobiae bacterium]